VQWNFENNGISNEWEPEIAYNQSGVYSVALTHIDSTSCNIVSTDTQLVNILRFPIANFVTDSNYYLYPDPVQFTNQSVFFDDFLWEFGDGTLNDLEENPLHQFEGIYEFTNCLSVSNEYCADTICKDIFIDFERLIGVPNAFSPNGDGVNDLLFVEGVGITNLNFKIFNRWGEVVFDTDNLAIGWDGIYRGIPQEMEVYTYLLNATFLDGESVKLAGNITLLR
jgi:gliding motility-associated-like protein